MDRAHARALLAGERARLERLLAAGSGGPDGAEVGDEVDDADRRDATPTDTAVRRLLRARWVALERAEARLATGRYGRSVRSGRPIPDERLEADPLAELTVEEAAAAERGAVQEPRRRGRLGVGRPSLRGTGGCRHHPGGGACRRGGRRRARARADPGHPRRAGRPAPLARSAPSATGRSVAMSASRSRHLP